MYVVQHGIFGAVCSRTYHLFWHASHFDCLYCIVSTPHHKLISNTHHTRHMTHMHTLALSHTTATHKRTYFNTKHTPSLAHVSRINKHNPSKLIHTHIISQTHHYIIYSIYDIQLKLSCYQLLIIIIPIFQLYEYRGIIYTFKYTYIHIYTHIHTYLYKHTF